MLAAQAEPSRRLPWPDFVPFLDFPVEIRKLIQTTSGIESLNARSALNILYLTVRERRPNRTNPTGRISDWKSILNALAITHGDRLNIS